MSAKRKQLRKIYWNRQNLCSLNYSEKYNERFCYFMQKYLFALYDRKPSTVYKKILRNFRTSESQYELRKNIKRGLPVSCKLDLEIIIRIQILVKEMTGSYVLMEEFLYFLIHWFVFFYSNKEVNTPPFVALQPKKYTKKQMLHKKFKQYYDTII